MQITLIAAMDRNGIIGNKEVIPWFGQVPTDMKHFRDLTLGKPVVMGRKTFESMGKALPERKNIVLTRNPSWGAPGVFVAASIEDVVLLTDNAPELMVIGGGEIYKMFLPLAHKIEITIIDHEFEGDTYFPEGINENEWVLLDERYFPADQKNHYSFWFGTFLSNQREF